MADVAVKLKWVGEGLQFEGGAVGGPVVRFDGNAKTGPSPLTTLLLALGGCMGADIVDISTKSRASIGGLDITVDGNRAADFPRRFTTISMKFTAHGVSDEDEPKLQRALEMSREKYCSVLHSLREDIAVDFSLVRD
jgi:putative redox protein